LSKSGKPLAFADCCARYLHDFDNTPAPDAGSLMRSRYSAFVLGGEDYLLATWHSSNRPADVKVDDGTKWLGLEVRRHSVIDADHAEVEFVARYRTQGRGARIHEVSRFKREAGRWYYVDGDLK
jgi:SEC-C motif-containing protein